MSFEMAKNAHEHLLARHAGMCTRFGIAAHTRLRRRHELKG